MTFLHRYDSIKVLSTVPGTWWALSRYYLLAINVRSSHWIFLLESPTPTSFTAQPGKSVSTNGQQGVNWNQVYPAEPRLLNQAEFQVEFQGLLCQEWEAEVLLQT